MARRLILDTNILIDIERGGFDRQRFLRDQLHLPAIVIAEFRVGIDLNPDTVKGRQATAALEVLLDFCTVLDYTQRTAEAHARLSAEARRSGMPRSIHDLIIAAHAAETGYTILTRDATARFGGLTGVRAIDPAGLTQPGVGTPPVEPGLI